MSASKLQTDSTMACRQSGAFAQGAEVSRTWISHVDRSLKVLTCVCGQRGLHLLLRRTGSFSITCICIRIRCRYVYKIYSSALGSRTCWIGAVQKVKLNVGRRRIVLTTTSSSTNIEPLAACSANIDRTLRSASLDSRPLRLANASL